MLRYCLIVVCCFLDGYNLLSQPITVDILIKDGIVFDGSLNDSARIDIGITADKIVYLSNKTKGPINASRVIDARNLWVAPGFIDPHTHSESDLSSAKKNANLPYLMQGVTTVMAGNDGISPFPIGTKLAMWQKQGIGTNVGLFVGHGTVRKLVVGDRKVTPTQDQLSLMKSTIDSAMRDGAFGISTGLFYAPGAYANTQEIIELATISAHYGGIYDTHIRDESSYSIGVERSVAEAIEIGEKSGSRVHISHIKALGVDVYGKSHNLIRMIERARSEGIHVTANQYPYSASRTSLIAALIPRWAEGMGSNEMIELISNAKPGDSVSTAIAENIRRRGGPESLQISGAKNDSLEHKNLHEVAQRWNVSDVEAVIRLIRDDSSVRVVSFNMTETDLENFTKQSWVMTGSDGTPGHPRKYGTFTKRLKMYALSKNTISPTFAIHASSGLTAETLQIKNRGYIKEGFFADIIIFDPKKLDTKATFENPDVMAEGMVHVLVNGISVIDNGIYNGKLAGKALRH